MPGSNRLYGTNKYAHQPLHGGGIVMPSSSVGGGELTDTGVFLGSWMVPNGQIGYDSSSSIKVTMTTYPPAIHLSGRGTCVSHAITHNENRLCASAYVCVCVYGYMMRFCVYVSLVVR